MERVYVIGHKNPDTDTVVSAILMARFLGDNYIPAMAGKMNAETEYVFKRFGQKEPEILVNAENLKLFLVDHNEESQMVEGAEIENIVGIVDHHKINFRNSHPIFLHFRPWGSTATVIYDLYKKEGKDVPDELKPLVLAAILSDTVILKSPTTTDVDRKVVEELSRELGIDYVELGKEMFKAKSKISEKSAKEILEGDFKTFEVSGKKIGIGQVEVVDLGLVKARYGEILDEMRKKKEEGYHTLILMATDIMKEGSELLIVSDEAEKIAEAFGTTLDGNVTGFIEGLMSRKKQVVPTIEKLFG